MNSTRSNLLLSLHSSVYNVESHILRAAQQDFQIQKHHSNILTRLFFTIMKGSTSLTGGSRGLPGKHKKQSKFYQHPLFPKKRRSWDFPDGPVAKTPCSQCNGPRFNPWSGNYTPHATVNMEDPCAKMKTQHSQRSRLINIKK